MTVVIYNDDGEPVALSRNLRGILTYARRYPVRRASVYSKGDGRAFVAFHFKGDAIARVDFESFIVAGDWVASRRSWGLRLAGHNASIRDYAP